MLKKIYYLPAAHKDTNSYFKGMEEKRKLPAIACFISHARGCQPTAENVIGGYTLCWPVEANFAEESSCYLLRAQATRGSLEDREHMHKAQHHTGICVAWMTPVEENKNLKTDIASGLLIIFALQGRLQPKWRVFWDLGSSAVCSRWLGFTGFAEKGGKGWMQAAVWEEAASVCCWQAGKVSLRIHLGGRGVIEGEYVNLWEVRQSREGLKHTSCIISINRSLKL